MRIISGSRGGRRLKAPAGAATRPTSDRVREALFSILGSPVEDAKILDVFAGSGTLGCEALSRGAAHATIIDNSKAALKCLRENLDALAFFGQSRILSGDAVKTMARLDDAFHWIFVDPPYAGDLVARIMPAAAQRLAPHGLIIVEHDRRNAPPAQYPTLVRIDYRQYGDTCLSIYQGTNGDDKT